MDQGECRRTVVWWTSAPPNKPKCFLGLAATPPTMKFAETSVWHNAVTASDGLWLLFADGDAVGRFRFDARDYRY